MKRFLASSVALLAATFSVHACSCRPAPPPAEAFAKADVVFAGRVESIKRANEHELKVTLRASEHWKGTNAATMVVHTPGDSALCGYPFVPGKEYLVYAEKGVDEDAERLLTGLCGRNALFSDAAEDLRFLRKEAKPLTK